MHALVYVYHILLIITSSTLIHKLIDTLHATLSLNKLGKYEYVIGIKVKHLPHGSIFLT